MSCKFGALIPPEPRVPHTNSELCYLLSCFRCQCDQRLRNVHCCLLADLQAHLRSKRMRSSPVHVCMVRSAALPLNFTYYMGVGDYNSVHIRLDGHFFCCIIVWLLVIAGRECVSNCFYVANLMIAANQTADAQEVWLLLSCAHRFLLAWSVHGIVA